MISISIYLTLDSQNRESIQSEKNNSEFIIIIKAEGNKLYLYKNGTCIKRYPIASGKTGWSSPIGEWKIVEKGAWGNAFAGYWMGLNVKWGIYGIHGTTNESSIGKAASHGCIRMYNKDIKALYNLVPLGTKVIIKNGKYGPFGTGFRNLEPGDRGADVLAVQKRLKQLGYFNCYESGIYEEDLKFAVLKFQKDRNNTVKNTITLPDYNAMGFILKP